MWWNEPASASWFRRLGRFARVILFDKRGTGLSDRLDRLPGMDERVDDTRAVMDATETPRAAIYGLSEGGSLAALFAPSPSRSMSSPRPGRSLCHRRERSSASPSVAIALMHMNSQIDVSAVLPLIQVPTPGRSPDTSMDSPARASEIRSGTINCCSHLSGLERP
jgi:hypothetical protein